MGEKKQIPRIVIAGTNSGCGKTTLVCALLQAFADRGLKTGAFKCGPDYIDPMFHSRIIGAESCNLDSFFFGTETLNYLLALHGEAQDINVIEGVMGFYDGIAAEGFAASTYEISQLTRSPVILAVNARGASASVLAVIHGFLTFCPDNRITGVILNQCTEMTYRMLKAQILEYFQGRIEPLGYLPVMKDCSLESRHLGLVTAQEVQDLKEKLRLLSAQAEKSLDMDRLMQIASRAEELSIEPPVLPGCEEPLRIAVARDRAFCFYYEDNLELLASMGVRIIPFSPLKDPALPEEIHGLYLGGGYPELYAGELSANESMRDSVKKALERGLPCIAECGGFMYLTQAISSGQESARMVGAVPGTCYNTQKLQRFGYVTLKARKDNLLCRKGEEIRAHEFHYWDCEDAGDGFEAVKPSGRSWKCVHAADRLYAGFPHFHFYANPSFAQRFLKACCRYKAEQNEEKREQS
ncbi:MAG: cobyrinate a,c-diamide synthase [Parasporobacterium sp.]|nr:cobyrinate a,c-diamide synthase [Parasporobacterium sp.]